MHGIPFVPGFSWCRGLLGHSTRGYWGNLCSMQKWWLWFGEQGGKWCNCRRISSLSDACSGSVFSTLNLLSLPLSIFNWQINMLLIWDFFQLFEVVVEVDDISDEQKARICKSLATADKVTFSEARLFFHTRLTNNNKSRRVLGKSVLYYKPVRNLGGPVLLLIENHNLLFF